jgi:hypothetical protein
MNNLFTYLDDFPKIPDTLLNEVYRSALDNPNVFILEWYENYKVHTATDELKEFLKQFFTNHSIQVHIIKDTLHIHCDYGRTIAFNYIIDSGGSNVETCFYNNDRSLIYSIKIDEHRWHRLDVSVLHNVINLERPRISITISPL